jgi:hypothetical protein
MSHEEAKAAKQAAMEASMNNAWKKTSSEVKRLKLGRMDLKLRWAQAALRIAEAFENILGYERLFVPKVPADTLFPMGERSEVANGRNETGADDPSDARSDAKRDEEHHDFRGVARGPRGGADQIARLSDHP